MMFTRTPLDHQENSKKGQNPRSRSERHQVMVCRKTCHKKGYLYCILTYSRIAPLLDGKVSERLEAQVHCKQLAAFYFFQTS